MPDGLDIVGTYQVFDHLIEGTQVLDREGRYVYVNHAVCVQAKCRREELLGKRLTEVFPGVVGSALETALRECLQSGEPRELQNEFAHLDGSTGYFQLRMQPVPEGVLVMSFDVTAQVEAERVLAQSNDELRVEVGQKKQELQIWERIAREALVVMRDGCIVDVNEGAVRLFGRDREELIGADPLGLVVDHDRERAAVRLASGAGEEAEFRCLRGDGGVVDVLAVACQLDVNGVSMRVASLVDISELRRVQHSVQAVIDSVPSQVAYWDTSLHNRMANFAHKDWFGLEPQELVGQHIRTMVDDDTWDGYKLLLDRTLAGEKMSFSAQLVRHSDQSMRDVDVSYIPDIVEGEVLGFVVHVVDMTEHKATEKRLEAALEEVRKSNDLLDKFAHTVAHDVRAPLRGITAAGNMLLEDFGSELPEGAHKRLSIMIKEAQRLDQFTVAILEYAQVGADRDPVPVRLRAAVSAAIENHQVLIRESGANIVVDGSDPFVRGNATQLVAVFQNLLGNAMKYRSKDAPKVTIRINEEGGQVSVDITDNGIGIAPAQRSRVFEMFKRLHHYDTYAGAGIGLATVRRAIESMHARVDIDPQFTGGTRVRIRGLECADRTPRIDAQ